MRSDATGWLVRRAHRVHRFVGSVLALLLAIWFASGIVMTFADYPRYSERERLARAAPLVLTGEEQIPAELRSWLEQGGSGPGSTLILAQVQGQARWLFSDQDGTRKALNATPRWPVPPLNADAARREAERLTGAHARSAERITEPDQWTVGHSAKGNYPLWRIELDGDAETELYLCAATGEVVQESTHGERLLAWLGPIPHWIYPAMLRRHRELWRTSVLWLSAFGLVVTLTGLASGIHVHLVLRKDGARKGTTRVRDPVLRWHQRLGLGFGVLASTWLFSGALSLTPFQWTGDGSAEERVAARLHPQVRSWNAAPGPTWLRCRPELDVRELHVVSFGGVPYIICLDGAGASRIIRQDHSDLKPLRNLELRDVEADVAAVAGPSSSKLLETPDAYYYPSHSFPDVSLPFLRTELHDDHGTTLYLDPARARLLAHYTTLTRIERWLYHGLHSFDFAPLYEHRALWRTVLIAAMVMGLALSLLGLFMAGRRAFRRRGGYQ